MRIYCVFLHNYCQHIAYEENRNRRSHRQAPRHRVKKVDQELCPGGRKNKSTSSKFWDQSNAHHNPVSISSNSMFFIVEESVVTCVLRYCPSSAEQIAHQVSIKEREWEWVRVKKRNGMEGRNEWNLMIANYVVRSSSLWIVFYKGIIVDRIRSGRGTERSWVFCTNCASHQQIHT